MAAALAKGGYELTPHEGKADIMLINTCAFILPAKEEAIGEILRLAQWKQKDSSRRLIVAGCLPQRYSAALERELPEVDLFIGTGEVGRIVQYVNEMNERRCDSRAKIGKPRFLMDVSHERLLQTPSHLAYLKIAEGCSNRCSYCIIPTIRGSYRSRMPDDILAEAEGLAAKGIKEVILIAQDTTAYGRDLKGKPRLSDLMKSLAALRDLRWIRLLYTHPESLQDDVLQIMASEEKICRYIDFPIQHISDDILKAMHRRTTGNVIRRKIERARALMPDVAFRTSIIVGFPGEKAAHFNELLDFVRDARFDHLGVFTYSREEGTPAATMRGTVPEKVKQKRRDLLMEEQAGISFQINQSLIGSVQEVIVEGGSDLTGYFSARARRQAPEIDGITYLKKKRGIRKGDIVSCRIVLATEYDLFAEIAPPLAGGSEF